MKQLLALSLVLLMVGCTKNVAGPGGPVILMQNYRGSDRQLVVTIVDTTGSTEEVKLDGALDFQGHPRRTQKCFHPTTTSPISYVTARIVRLDSYYGVGSIEGSGQIDWPTTDNLTVIATPTDSTDAARIGSFLDAFASATLSC